jgi:hypothetical protein
VDRYLTRNLCTILAVALNRLQHGVKAHLASVACLKQQFRCSTLTPEHRE